MSDMLPAALVAQPTLESATRLCPRLEFSPCAGHLVYAAVCAAPSGVGTLRQGASVSPFPPETPSSGVPRWGVGLWS